MWNSGAGAFPFDLPVGEAVDHRVVQVPESGAEDSVHRRFWTGETQSGIQAQCATGENGEKACSCLTCRRPTRFCYIGLDRNRKKSNFRNKTAKWCPLKNG